MDSTDLVELEGRLRRDTAGDLRARLDQVARAATAVYLAAAGDTRHKLPEHAQATLRRLLIEQFDQLADYNFAEIRSDLRGAARDLIEAGARDVDPDTRVKLTTPLDLRWALTDLTAGMRADLKAARLIARTGRLERYGDLQAILTAMRKATNRADRAAQWVTHRAHNEGRLRAAERLASRGEQVAMLYRPERDACARCLSYAGSLAGFGEPFHPTMQLADAPLGPIDGPWDQHPHCLPGDALVASPARVVGATVRHFVGDLVILHTGRGQEFRATPNHPVLTDHGWVAVGLIAEGDQVVGHLWPERKDGVHEHDHQVPARVEDVANAFLGASGVTTIEVPVTAIDFHGDGAGSEVAVVGTYRRLSIPAGQPLGHDVLDGGGARPGAGLCLRHLGEVLRGADHAAYGVMGGGSERLPILGGGLRHADGLSVATAARLDTLVEERRPDGPTGDGIALAQRLLTDAGQVFLDEVVSVRREPFSGHVYNLQTEAGWYIGSGIVTHNCRCEIEPWFGETEGLDVADLPVALQREAQRSAATGVVQGSEKARVRAADALLRLEDLLIPKTVQRKARKAVEAGSFKA